MNKWPSGQWADPNFKINKWPLGQWADPNFKIKVQQNGAGVHCSHTDEYLTMALEDLGLTDKMSLYTQPPNSPDLNMLELGLFNALQAVYYYDTAPRNEVELITMVEETYEGYPSSKRINMLFLTLQTIFKSIIEVNGNSELSS
jgi:hypothetical protein